MSLRKRSLLVWLGIGVAGCEFIHPPTAIEPDEEPVVVHAVLAAGSSRAAVLLTRVGSDDASVSGGDETFEPGVEPVSGAEVRLVTDAGTVRLTEEAEGFPGCVVRSTGLDGHDQTSTAGCYGASIPGGIRSGVKYQLHVRLPDGRSIGGEAVPPPAVTLLVPAPHTVIAIRRYGQGNRDLPASVPVRLHAAAEVAGVGLAIRPAAVFLNGARASDVECDISSSSHVLPPERADGISLHVPDFPCHQGEGANRKLVQADSVHARLYVTAYDAAFMRYQAVLREKQVAPEEAAQGISGALGLFAGAATVERIITLVPSD